MAIHVQTGERPKLSFRYAVAEGQQELDFSVIFIRDQALASSTAAHSRPRDPHKRPRKKRRSTCGAADTGYLSSAETEPLVVMMRDLAEVVAVPAQRGFAHHGDVQWNSDDEGLIILRWVRVKPVPQYSSGNADTVNIIYAHKAE